MKLRVAATILLLILLIIAALTFAPGEQVQAQPPQGMIAPLFTVMLVG